ncbi:hypothetical protein [Paracoccus halophilus]|uniref:hypothetical protein n=1 Tax=Paracoccus halophilus TaxID=376733 RepID=UPI00111426BE|nr:hypothetical protein [Paracoccus halophilus]
MQSLNHANSPKSMGLEPKERIAPSNRGIKQLVGFSDGEKKVIVFTHNKVTKGDEKVLPFAIGDYTADYMQGGIAQVKGNPPSPQQPQPFTHHNGRYACGSSIFPAHCIGAGTFGLIVQDAQGRCSE